MRVSVCRGMSKQSQELVLMPSKLDGGAKIMSHNIFRNTTFGAVEDFSGAFDQQRFI